MTEREKLILRCERAYASFCKANKYAAPIQPGEVLCYQDLGPVSALNDVELQQAAEGWGG